MGEVAYCFLYLSTWTADESGFMCDWVVCTTWALLKIDLDPTKLFLWIFEQGPVYMYKYIGPWFEDDFTVCLSNVLCHKNKIDFKRPGNFKYFYVHTSHD